DGFPVKTGRGVMPGPADTYIAYGKGWANASNTPFRMYKHWVHEGGIASPLIAHWPKQIQRKGDFERQPSHLIDLMATCVDIAKAQYPSQYKGQPIKPLEGQSLIPAFAGQSIDRDALYWEHEGNRAIRQGKWKLVAKGATGPWELYDIGKDRTELNNLAAELPEKTKELAQKWDVWAKRANVYPLTPYYGNRLSKKKKFNLKTGVDLPKSQAPNVKNRAFKITGKIEVQSPNGVIIAQGGTAHGYSLYLKEKKLHFAVRRNNELEVLASIQDLPANSQIELAFAKNGRVRVKVNDSLMIDGKVKGSMIEMPIDGLQVGQDANGNVGDYTAPYALKMSGDLKLELE
ncbi:MAG: sulfatase/phosphatase domain-containing protein, partial [Planctomycetota bacterium]|nr:sulfatase/phosphatase domain-containing protein [Planctomycetota bacterium]